MEIKPYIFNAKVMHKRLFPKINKFTYCVYYLVLPLSKLGDKVITKNLSVNKPAILSFYEKDHGDYSGSLNNWVQKMLQLGNVNVDLKDVILVTMPRIFFYVFNPVSFYLCLDQKSKLRAVLCEVNNTFGETHTYICKKKNNAEITADDWLEAKKLFHVSPFLKIEGHYKFRFALSAKKLGVWIDFYNDSGKKQLITSLIGSFKPLTKNNLRIAFIKHPLVTIKTILLIHWQALKLLAKGIKLSKRN